MITASIKHGTMPNDVANNHTLKEVTCEDIKAQEGSGHYKLSQEKYRSGIYEWELGSVNRGGA